MDPLSIVAGTAGFVSLGLTVCKGLTTFYNDYRFQDADIESLGGNADRLQTCVLMTQKRLHTDGEAEGDIKASIQDCISACEICLGDVKTFITKKSAGSKGTGRDLVRRVAFPLHRERLETLRAQIQEFHSALSTKLALLNIDRTEALHQATLLKSAQLSSTVIDQARQLSSEVSQTVPDLAQVIDLKLGQFGYSLHERLEALESSVSSAMQPHDTPPPYASTCLDSVKPPGKQNLSIYRRQNQYANTANGSLYPISESSSLASWGSGGPTHISGVQQRQFPISAELSEKVGGMSLLGHTCTCSRMTHGARIPTIPSHNNDIFHEKTCPMSIFNRKSHQIQGKMKVFNFLIRCEIAISYSYQAFTRDLRVSPNFTMRSTVDYDAPAFSLLETTFRTMRLKSEMSPIEMTMAFQGCLRGLQSLFLDGRAWPTDIKPNGASLVNEAIQQSSGLDLTDSTVSVWLQFFKDLVALGAPLQTDALRDPFGVYFALLGTQSMNNMHRASSISETKSTILPKLSGGMDLIAVVHDSSDILDYKHGVWSREASEVLYACDGDTRGLHELLGYGALCTALIQRDEASVKSILENFPDSLLEIGPAGETPYHLAVSWPWGIELLLNFGASHLRYLVDTPDSESKTPLQYAVYLRQPETTKLLLDANATIDLENIGMIDRRPGPRYDYGESEEITRLLCNGFADRRRQLLEFALVHLPEDIIHKCRLREQKILQHHTDKVIQALEQRHISIPRHLKSTPYGSVYHPTCFDMVMSEAFFNAGFDSVDIRLNSLTPLMTVYLNVFVPGSDPLLMVEWFESKGADLQAPVPVGLSREPPRSSDPVEHEKQYRTVHRLANISGQSWWHKPKDQRYRGTRQLQNILSNDSEDCCSCYCSPGGCTPASIFARQLCAFRDTDRWLPDPIEGPRKNPWGRHFDVVESVEEGQPQLLKSFIYYTELAWSASQSLQVAESMVRVATLDRMGMKHTCCTWPERGFCMHAMGLIDYNHAKLQGQVPIVDVMEPGEAAEIQEEDRHSADTLESLMAEFSEELGCGIMSVAEFFSKVWGPKMDEFENRKEILSAENVAALRDMGVVLEQPTML